MFIKKFYCREKITMYILNQIKNCIKTAKPLKWFLCCKKVMQTERKNSCKNENSILQNNQMLIDSILNLGDFKKNVGWNFKILNKKGYFHTKNGGEQKWVPKIRNYSRNRGILAVYSNFYQILYSLFIERISK